jgi:fatty acid desaturase
MSDEKKPTDMREYRKRSERVLLGLVVLFLVVVGAVAIGLIYGWGAALTGLLCLLPGAVVLVVLWLFLVGVDRFTDGG